MRVRHLLFFLVPFFVFVYFFFNDTATTEIYTLSLHDALPISNHLTAANVLTDNSWSRNQLGTVRYTCWLLVPSVNRCELVAVFSIHASTSGDLCTRRLYGAYQSGNQGTRNRTCWDATG